MTEIEQQFQSNVAELWSKDRKQIADLLARVKELESAENVLDGRLGFIPNAVTIACQEYCAAEDELPEHFDSDDYRLSKSVKSLVSQVKELEGELLEWEKRENSVCSEDTPFEEVIKCLRRQLHQRDTVLVDLRWDIEAYRGALGYSVPGNHTGKLTDGTTPECGICNSQHRKDIDTALNAARVALEWANGVSPTRIDMKFNDQLREMGFKCDHALSQIQAVKP